MRHREVMRPIRSRLYYCCSRMRKQAHTQELEKINAQMGDGDLIRRAKESRTRQVSRKGQSEDRIMHILPLKQVFSFREYIPPYHFYRCFPSFVPFLLKVALNRSLMLGLLRISPFESPLVTPFIPKPARPVPSSLLFAA